MDKKVTCEGGGVSGLDEFFKKDDRNTSLDRFC